MTASLISAPRQVLTLRWQPNKDMLVVALSWLLVVGALYTATVVVGTEALGGLAYFGLYAVLGATVVGIGLPLFWMTVVRHRPLTDLGITRRHLGKSLLLQVILSGLLYASALADASLPTFEQFVPLVALALAIGFFEAVFWRGWVLLRLEESFGFLPALVLGSVLYALYHVGYAMPMDEIGFLFFIGVLYAVTFRLTNSVFILWPAFQPLGQLLTLVRDGLTLPFLSALGFAEVLVAMLVIVYLAGRYHRRWVKKESKAEQAHIFTTVAAEGHGVR
ncbi:MAG: CPBP family intramembrane metalloprotease [Dehalococcoidales bacterium]|nr:CPBP family intramembrane metalloprotease [Dehalococcoidales bacterium]